MFFAYTFDFRKETLTRKKDMILPRCNHVLEIDHDTVYVFGGGSRGRLIDRCEKYGVTSDSWLLIENLPAVAPFLSSTKDKNYIYIVNRDYNEIYRFDLVT